MAQLFIQDDAVTRVMDRLSTAVPDPERVRMALPDGWTPRDGPYIVVASDGTPTSSRGWTKEFVRVRVQARDIFTARQLMQQVDAFLLSPGIHRLGLPISAATGVIAGADSKLGGFFASATYSVQLPRKVF